MKNVGLDEVPAGIKIAGRNIKKSDMQTTPPSWQKFTLMMKVKEDESERGAPALEGWFVGAV